VAAAVLDAPAGVALAALAADSAAVVVNLAAAADSLQLDLVQALQGLWKLAAWALLILLMLLLGVSWVPALCVQPLRLMQLVFLGLPEPLERSLRGTSDVPRFRTSQKAFQVGPWF
jgi:hypothetical protein